MVILDPESPRRLWNAVRLRSIYVLPVVAVLFLVGFLANVANGEVPDGDSVAPWGIAVAALAAFWFVRDQQRERARFEAYLRQHLDEVRAGTASWGGHPISYATELRVYHLVLSFLLVSVKLPSRLVIAGADGRLRAGCTLVTLVFGWWGIPWGPVWTVGTIGRNLAGPSRLSVGELLEGKSAVALPQSRAR